MKPRIFINIIGTGYEVHCGRLDDTVLDQLQNAEKAMGRRMEEVLFDPEFYLVNELRDANGRQYNSVHDFNDLLSVRGADLNQPGQLEIWINKKRIRYKFHEIAGSGMLFPIFEIKVAELPDINGPSSVSIGFQEKGHLGKWMLEWGEFMSSELILHVMNLNLSGTTVQLLFKLSYGGKVLRSVKEDTVITGTVFMFEL